MNPEQLTSEEKLQARIDAWLAIDKDVFKSEQLAENYRERVQRIIDTVNLKQPDRVPAFFLSGQLVVELSDVTHGDAYYNYDKYASAIIKFMEDYQPDYKVVRPGALGPIYDLLGYQLYKWPGGELPENLPMQYIEGEYMSEKDYPLLTADPTGYMLRNYLPRIFKNLQGLSMSPNFFQPIQITGIAGMLLPLTVPRVREAYEKLLEAGAMLGENMNRANKMDLEITGRWGSPSMISGFSFAPFDIIADTMRGTRGALMDLYRRPQELLAAVEAVISNAIDMAIKPSWPGAAPTVLIPLHKGADSFMSLDQFREFYWPSLEKMLLGIVAEGVIPIVFVEGSYNRERMELIAEAGLPEGKMIWLFDKSDMNAAKEIIGPWSCIAGNVSTSLLATGSAEEVDLRCRQLIEAAGEGGGYILATGAPIDHARPDNIRAFLAASEKYGKY